jgi:proteic killer suppression protein
VITSFRHKGLRQFYETGSKAGIQAQQAGRLRLILARLDAAREPRDMNLPGLRLHSMGGDLAGFWSVSVSGNWRVIFRFNGQDVCDVDCLDYH